MSDKKPRISAQVEQTTKTKVEILAQRQNLSESELIRMIVSDYLDEHEIPDEVIRYFEENSNTAEVKTC